MVGKKGEMLGILILRSGFRVLEYLTIIMAAISAFYIIMQNPTDVMSSFTDFNKFGGVFMFLFFAASFEFITRVFDLKVDEIKQMMELELLESASKPASRPRKRR